MSAELHLFILWSRAQPERDRIIQDISGKFGIIEINDIKWDEDNFPGNITRFYGEKLPPGSFKEVECGSGRFTMVVVLDNQPVYAERDTTKGIKRVNAAMFDAKELYREWTGGGHKIHATNDPAETRHDIVLLTGKTSDEYVEMAGGTTPAQMIRTDRNLSGCIQWNSLDEAFRVLNETSSYLVLRNFEDMPGSYCMDTHGDVDLLVSDPAEVAYLLNLSIVFRENYRVHYRMNINNQTIRVDLRSPGDGYYDRDWQESMLEARVLQNGFYVPAGEDHKYSLLYHALVHKRAMDEDYRRKLVLLGFDQAVWKESILQHMEQKGYRVTEPLDLSVYFNSAFTKTRVSSRRRLYGVKLLLVRALKWLFPVSIRNRIKHGLVNRIRGFFR